MRQLYPTGTFSISNVLFVSKGIILLLFYYTAAGVKCHVAAVKRLRVLHHSADYIFIFFGITGPIVVSLKMEFCSCER